MADAEDRQGETIHFLKSRLGGDVEEMRTHISVVLLGRDRVWKLKRAIALPYVDFLDPRVRLEDCERELALNRRTAPSLYRRVLRVTRRDGELDLDGDGELVDAVVEMARFASDDLLDRVAAEGRLTDDLAGRLAGVVADFHRGLSPVADAAASQRLAKVAAGVERSLRDHAGMLGGTQVERCCDRCREALAERSAQLDARGRKGAVVLGHGDLHLGNICLWEGAPTLFDCLEFDGDLATIDRLYDLAFLLMDVWRRGSSDVANLILNRYLDRVDDETDLGLLPLFMSVRAAIRAHVCASQSKVAGARAFLGLAIELLRPTAPQLVAVGGFSGSGKSTIAAAIADGVGSPPGARILGTDRIRKALLGVDPTTRLPSTAYSLEMTEEVYARLARRAGTILASGWSVVAEATFSSREERDRIQRVAEDAGVAFSGIWLGADPDTLRERIEDRRNDVSDADVEVLERQLRAGPGAMPWIEIDAHGRVENVARRVLDVVNTRALASA
jgi:aminoglycoside phosphotransferase family enzyme/predicted kinase